MLTIDPRTGAVAPGWSGRSVAFVAVTVAFGLAGSGWLASLAEEEEDLGPLEVQEVELADDDLVDADDGVPEEVVPQEVVEEAARRERPSLVDDQPVFRVIGNGDRAILRAVAPQTPRAGITLTLP